MTDWAALAPAVLEALEREGQMPPRTRGAQRPDTLRFGTHGSLAVNLERGTWTDFETDESGGVIDLVKRRIEPRSHNTGAGVDRSSPSADRQAPSRMAAIAGGLAVPTPH